MLRIFAVAVPFSVAIEILAAVFRGFDRVEEKVYFRDVLMNVLKVLFIVSVIILGYSFLEMISAYTLSIVITSVAFIIYAIKKLPIVRGAGTDPIIKELFLFSLPLLLTNALSIIIIQIDTLMLGYFKTASIVGLYNAAHPISQLINIFLLSLVFIYVPVTSQLYSKNLMNEIRRNYKILTKWITSATFPFFLIIFLFPEAVLKVLFGSEYVQASVALALQILALGMFIHVFLGPNASTLIVIGRTKLNLMDIAVSETTKRRLVDLLKVNPNKIVVISNGVELKKFEQKGEKEYGRILYVGRLESHKRVDMLIQSYKGLKRVYPDIELIIVGKGPQKEYLQNLSKEQNLEDVTFYDPLPYDRLIEIMKSSWILVQPSIREGQGIVLLEAMAAGTPPVAVQAEGSAVGDVIKNNYNGLLVPEGGMKGAIQQLLTDENLDRFISRMVDKYSITKVLEMPANGVMGIPGIKSLIFAELGCEVTVVHPSKEFLDNARRIWEAFGLDANFVKSNWINTGFNADSFDLVWNFCVFEHFDEPKSVIQEMLRVTKRYIFIEIQNVFNPGFPIHRFYHFVRGEPWDHGSPGKMKLSRITSIIDKLDATVVETGATDMPPWPDINIRLKEMAAWSSLLEEASELRPAVEIKPMNEIIKDIHHVEGLSLKREIVLYLFDIWYRVVESKAPASLKKIFAHHPYIIAEKIRCP